MRLRKEIHQGRHLEEASSFHPGGLTFVRPTLEAAGAKVLNVFYDDDNILRDALRERDLTKINDASDSVAFLPPLTAEIMAAALRSEIDEAGKRIRDRIQTCAHTEGVARAAHGQRGQSPDPDSLQQFDYLVIRKNSIRAPLGVSFDKSRPVTMLRALPHAIHFKPILDFGEGQLGQTNK
jgi:hypothetical protein